MINQIAQIFIHFFAIVGLVVVAKGVYRFFKYGMLNEDPLLSGSFLDDVDAALIVVLPNGKIRYINDAAKKYFPEYVNKPVVRREDFDFNFENAEGQFQIEKDGKTFKVSVKKIVKRGKTLGVKLLITEVSNLLYLEKQAELNSEENARLLTNISHEIRTPLNAIIGASEVLTLGNGAPNPAYVEVIHNEALKLNSMLDSLLSASTNEKEAEEPQTQEKLTAEGVKALVVDDTKTNLLMAKQMLGQFGVEADVVESGYACINLLENGAVYDIIFMDYMMEGMSGTETTEYIRRLKGSISSVPIIAFTANSVEGAREMYLAAGMNDCLFKPAGKQAFGEMLRKYVSSKLSFKDGNNDKTAESQEEGYPVIDGIDYEDAEKYSGGNVAVFKDILATFYNEVPERIDRISNCFSENDLKNFVVEVHGVKSQARTMGMRDLSTAMADMEHAGIDGNYEYIDDNLEELFALYKKWAERVRPVAEEKLNSGRKASGKEKAEEVLIKIHELLEDFEMEDAEGLFKTIWPGEYSEERQALMLKLKTSIDDIDYYASLDYVDKLLDTYSE